MRIFLLALVVVSLAIIGSALKTHAEGSKQVILEGVCRRHGFGDTCAKHLLAMHLVETSGNCKAVGALREQGCFQIRLKMHRDVTLECAQDIACSGEWTLNRLIENGYADNYVTYSIQRHNGSGVAARRYALRVLAKAKTL